MAARFVFLLLTAPVFAQPVCPVTPAWSTCDLAFDLQPGETAGDLRAEFRSPHHRTYMLPAFRDGDRRMVIRFSPTESGTWDYHVTSLMRRFDGVDGHVSAGESDSPGFVRIANVHHFLNEATGKAHLWMATELDLFVTIPRAEFDQAVERRAKQKFTHLRVTLERDANLAEAADRVRAINAHGMAADLALASIPEDAGERKQYMTDIVARFAAFNITWMGVPSFENVAHGRAILKDAGGLIKTFDPYDHPRTTLAAATSAGLLMDGWLSVIDYGTPDPNVGAVEHQLYQDPALNTGIKNERDLWNATMNGQYPASGSGPYMTAWFEFMSGNRYWELEPYFDLDGGRALALEGVEYIIYIEKPGPVEVRLEHHGYDVSWIDPATGESTKEKKGYSGEHFTGEPPDRSHPWVLHISREGTKEGMLKSWKFESRPVPVQEIEQNPQKVPFDIDVPAEGDVSISHPPYFAIKVKRETRSTRSLLVEWTGEIPIDSQGLRVVGTGREGTLRIPPSIADKLPAALDLRMAVLNANGKVYVVDKIYRLIP
jgi:hypothetical protein